MKQTQWTTALFLIIITAGIWYAADQISRKPGVNEKEDSTPPARSDIIVTIADQMGKAVEGVSITLLPEVPDSLESNPGKVKDALLTDKSGTCRFAHIPAGFAVIEVRHHNRLYMRHAIEINQPSHTVSLTLAQTKMIFLSVFDSQGQPVKEAGIISAPVPVGRDHYPEGVTGEKGQLIVNHFPDTLHRIYAGYNGQWSFLDLAKGKTSAKLVLKETAERIIQAKDDAENSVTGFELTAGLYPHRSWALETITFTDNDQDGRISVPLNLADTWLSISANPPENRWQDLYSSAYLDLRPAQQNGLVTFIRRPEDEQLSSMVLLFDSDTASEKEPESFLVRIQGDDFSAVRVNEMLTGGRFSIDRLPPGPVQILVNQVLKDMVWKACIDLEPGKTHRVQVQLSKAAHLSLKFDIKEFRQLHDPVHWRFETIEPGFKNGISLVKNQTAVDNDIFELNGLPAGQFRLVLSDYKGRTGGATYHLNAGEHRIETLREFKSTPRLPRSPGP